MLIDIYIKNNEEIFNYTNIPCKYKENKYVFSLDKNRYEIIKEDSIVFHKENDDSIIEFEFKKNTITKGTYFIKDLNFYMDAKVKTTKYIINNDIEIDYKLWLQDEEIGDFIFKLKVKE